MTTREEFYRWWATLTNEERVNCWYDLDAMAHGEAVSSLRSKLAATEAKLVEAERATKAMRAVWEWTKGHKYRSLTGPHWNYCDFEMWVRAEPDHPISPEWVVNHADPATCYVLVATKLGLLEGG